MPRYMGKGENFYLVRCELMPLENVGLEKKKKFHGEVCGKCGIYKDWVRRRDKALRLNKKCRQLICVHPKNRVAWEKWKPHVTIWGR